MSNELYALTAILLMGVATFATRSLPFFLLGKFEDHRLLNSLGRNLPPAIMIILVVYCLKDVKVDVSPFGLPELISVIVVGALQVRKRNALLSILVGTVLYLVLVKGVA